MKSLFLAGFLAPALFLGTALPVLLGAAAPAAAQRSGLYEVTGTNLDGSSYRGLMELRQVGHSTFHIMWNIGGQLIEGVGMASGLTFVTAFTSGNQTGFGIYEIKPGDLLEGTWTIVGAPTTGTENARPAQLPAQGAPAPGATPDSPPAAAPSSPAPATPALPPARN